MSLRNLIKEWIHSDKVKEYEEFVRNHEKAINSYLFDGYRPRYIILQEDLDLFSEYDKQVDIIRKEFPNTILDHFTFEQKELLLSRKETILELYRVYLKSKVIFDNTNNIFRKFPHAYNIICKEITGKKLRSVDMPKSRNMNNIPAINSIYDLSPEQKAQILDRITEFPDLEEDCIEALKREQIHEKFENEILSDYNRRRFYKNFIKKYAPGVNDEEEYCVYHIPQLDKYVKKQFYSFRFISQIVYDKRRSKYYKDFLKLHSIKETEQEEYCVNHIKDLDSFIKQQLQNRERLFNEWEKEQEEFTDDCFYLIFESVEFTVYNIDFDRTDINGNTIKGKYQFEHYYYYPYCNSSKIDYTLFPHFKENNDLLSKLQMQQYFFPIEKYKIIADFINTIANNAKVLVYFNDLIVGWWDSQLFAHYSLLIPLLNDKVQIFNPTKNDFQTSQKDEWINLLDRRIVIVDFATESGYPQELCKKIITKAIEKRPLITYISMMRGYSEEEMQQLTNSKKVEIKEKEKEEEFAKIVLSDNGRATHYISFCESNNIPSDEQKEYVLNNLSLLDSYISDLQKKEARLLRQETIDADWEERCSNHFRSFSLFNYYPTTCEWEADDDEWRVRRLTWNFKYSYGKNIMSIDHTIALNEIIPLVEKVLIGTFGDDLPKLTLACIPASTKLDTARRYEEFSIRLCRETKMINAYYYIQVTQDGTAKHTNGMNSTPAKIEIDKDFFKKKYVLIFDDVITRGRSMLSFRQKLVEAGAFVIGGMSVGRTMHVRLGNHPIDSFGKNSNNYDEVPPF